MRWERSISTVRAGSWSRPIRRFATEAVRPAGKKTLRRYEDMRTFVENMRSSRGNKIANQFVIQTDDGLVFQSYNTIIARKNLDGTVELDVNNWDYSTTTGKYRNQFLRETKKETERKVASGEYKLVDLNG
jgi:hypothetical protein